MKSRGPALILSLILHAGLLALAFVSFRAPAKLDISSAVPVEIVSDIPASEMAKAPVDPLAVKPPEPEPEPEVPPVLQPKPVPAPPAPVPKPDKTPKKPDPKASQAPTKDGMKKPQPKSLDLNALSQPQLMASKSKTRTLASPSVRPTNGASNFGAAAQDMGPTVNALKAAVQRNWSPCHRAGADHIVVTIRFTLSKSGLVSQGPDWVDPRADGDSAQAAALAKASVINGQPYVGLPDPAYNRSFDFTFDPINYCKSQR